ncbi:hypothetical protein BDP55DRAFT_675020 [Colletotrichum godetiae]|uniref:Ankyrin repeat protein n=1 Tax=Colletotrichum godetiae TaxID=1209918 RepID=A0AAJ0ADI2_9PEZI|nr:uncharacterized protein BDP55DRAFT_675020 [Colletotrichum godetiae]KAK1671862.1 hypothetical protein BDP55DRAFT_675020 [Colletotrichum godetiae]
MQTRLMLGIAYTAAGKNDDAEATLIKVRNEMEEIWGWSHIATMACTKSLVQVLESLERYDEARDLYEIAIKAVRCALGSEYPWTLELCNNFACFRARRSEFDDAKKLFEDVYQAKRHVLGQHHRSTLDALCNLCRLSPASDHSSDELAMEIAVQALRQGYDDDSIVVLSVVKHLSFLYQQGGNAEKMQALCNEFEIEALAETYCTAFHVDTLIPPLKTRGQTQDVSILPFDIFQKVLSKIGPTWAKRSLRGLERTRNFIYKWTGMDVRTFTQHFVADEKWIEWGGLINPAVLLEEACAAGHEPAVEMLLERYDEYGEHDDEMNLDMQGAFRKAVVSGSEPVVRLLLDRSVEINHIDEAANTALHDAAKLGHDAVSGLLVESGADTHAMNEDGNTPMDMAMMAGHEGVVRLFMGHNGAILTSSTTAGGSPSVAKDLWYERLQRTGFDATVVHFYIGGRDKEVDATNGISGDAHRVQIVPVEELVGNFDNVLCQVLENRTEHETFPEADFRWIHLPANCMDWVEALLTTLQLAENDDQRCPDLLKNELWMRQLHDPPYSSVHGRFMKPLCREIPGFPTSSGSMVAFMPYLHWESDEKRREMNEKIAKVNAAQTLDMARLTQALKNGVKGAFGEQTPHAGTEDKNMALLGHYLFPVPPQSPVHLRRTLDQFQYYMTESTEDRDSDQVISRYFKRRHPDIPLPVMMIDQLWIWVLNQKTVVTSFPQRWDNTKGSSRDNRILDTGNVLDSVLTRLKQKERTPIGSVFDLSELIMARCLGLNYERIEWEYERYRYLEIFDYSINYVAHEEVRCFNEFANRANSEDSGKDGIGETKLGKQKRNQRSKEEEKKQEVGKQSGGKINTKAAKKVHAEPVPSVGEEIVAEWMETTINSRHSKDRGSVVSAKSGAQNYDDVLSRTMTEDETTGNPLTASIHGRRSGTSTTSKEIQKRWRKEHEDAKTEKKKKGEILNELARLLSKRTASKPPRKVEDSFDISHEVELLREIKDIRDELNILGNLFSQQKLVLETFTRIVEARRRDGQVPAADITHPEPSLSHAVQRHIAYVESLDKNAERVYRHLEDLLDLKQKQANVFEARNTRVSGNTITVFTIVTIVFLPASFMAAFLALPILEYPSVGDDKMGLAYAVKNTVITTVAVAFPFIVFALYVNPIFRIARVLTLPFQNAARSAYEARPFLLLLSRVISNVLWLVFKHLSKLVKLLALLMLWSLRLLLLMLVNWRRVFIWTRGMRDAKREARSTGQKWKNRRYVTGYLLRKLNRPEQSEGDDVEEQRAGEVSSETQSSRLTYGASLSEVSQPPVDENAVSERAMGKRVASG